MLRYAIITDGKVSAIKEWDGKFDGNEPQGYMVRSDVAELGDAYDTETGMFPDHVVTNAELVSEPALPADAPAAADGVIDHVEHTE